MANSIFTPTTLGFSSAAAGSGEINAILNPNAANSSTDGWTGVSAITGSNSPLSPATTTAFSISNAAATESSTSGGYSTFTLPNGLQNKKLKVEFYFTTPATDVYRVSVYKAGTRVALSTDSSSVTTLPASTTGKFVAYFDTDTTSSWSINITRTSGTIGPCYITNVIVGPGIQPQGAVVGPWQSDWAPTGSWTTNTTYAGKYRRVGSSIEADVQVSLSGAPGGGTTFTLSLPSGISVDAAAMAGTPVAAKTIIGTGSLISAGSDLSIYVAYNDTLTVRLQTQTGMGSITKTSPGTFTTGDSLKFRFMVPIAEWAGSGTVNLAQNDVEFAADDGTSDVFGPNGTLVPDVAFSTGTTIRDFVFTTPPQANDYYVLEINQGTGTPFAPATMSTPWFRGANANSNNRYGIRASWLDATTFRVEFGNQGTSVASTGADNGVTAWTTARTAGIRWRVRKTSGGAAVGFGLADASSSGLVSTTAQTFSGTKGIQFSNSVAFSATTADYALTLENTANDGGGRGEKILFVSNQTGAYQYSYIGHKNTSQGFISFGGGETLATMFEKGSINGNGTWTLGPSSYTGEHKVNGELLLQSTGVTAALKANIELNSNSTGFNSTYSSRSITTENGAAIFLGSFTGTGSDPLRFYISPVGSAINTSTLVGSINNAFGWTIGTAGANHKIYGGDGSTTAGNEVLAIQTGAATSGSCRLITYYDTSNDACGYINIDATANTVSVVNSSDFRLKHKFEDFNALALIEQMKPAEYERISNPGVKELGLVAQELQQVCPQLVAEGGDDPSLDPWGINYTGLIPVLVKAIKELKNELDKASLKIATLETK